MHTSMKSNRKINSDFTLITECSCATRHFKKMEFGRREKKHCFRKVLSFLISAHLNPFLQYLN